MKKLILLFALGMFVVSCSKDATTEEQIENNAFLESVDPDTATPKAALDGSSLGMYHGYIATLDNQLNAKLWINAGNDDKFNATARSITGEKYSFFSHEADMAGTVFIFKGAIGNFTLDISDSTNPVVSEVRLNGTEGVSTVFKEFSYQRGFTSLGSYVDDVDGAFTGFWNILSDGTPHPAGAGVIGQQVDVLGPGGNLFQDMLMEPFDFACFGQTGIPPLMWIDPGVQNEMWFFEQTSTWLGLPAQYDLGVSPIIRDGNNLAYADVINRDSGGVAGCFIATQQGTWTWNGRTGTVSFPDIVPLPVLGCADPLLVTADSGGEIVNYRNDENITRVVTTGDASPMSLYFYQFDIEDGWDFLDIYDGPDATGTLIGTYTGTELQGLQVDGTGDSLTLVFASDGSVNAPGWAAEVCGVAPPPLVCDEDFVDTGGTAGNYGVDEDTTTTYTAPGLGEVVEATFQIFNLENGWDFMRVYDGPIEDALTEVTDINGQMTSTGSGGGNGFTGTQLQGEVFTSSGADLTFVFESDASVTAPGWEICINYITPVTVSPGPLVKDMSKDIPFVRTEVSPATLNK
ncbi:MAG: CUB domain-containing protein [Gilvibacter sp.]